MPILIPIRSGRQVALQAGLAGAAGIAQGLADDRQRGIDEELRLAAEDRADRRAIDRDNRVMDRQAALQELLADRQERLQGTIAERQLAVAREELNLKKPYLEEEMRGKKLGNEIAQMQLNALRRQQYGASGGGLLSSLFGPQTPTSGEVNAGERARSARESVRGAGRPEATEAERRVRSDAGVLLRNAPAALTGLTQMVKMDEDEKIARMVSSSVVAGVSRAMGKPPTPVDDFPAFESKRVLNARGQDATVALSEGVRKGDVDPDQLTGTIEALVAHNYPDDGVLPLRTAMVQALSADPRRFTWNTLGLAADPQRLGFKPDSPWAKKMVEAAADGVQQKVLDPDSSVQQIDALAQKIRMSKDSESAAVLLSRINQARAVRTLYEPLIGRFNELRAAANWKTMTDAQSRLISNAMLLSLHSESMSEPEFVELRRDLIRSGRMSVGEFDSAVAMMRDVEAAQAQQRAQLDARSRADGAMRGMMGTMSRGVARPAVPARPAAKPAARRTVPPLDTPLIDPQYDR